MTTETKKVIGRIIKVSDEGWGFISSKEIKFTRIFFHWTHLKQDTLPFLELKSGMMVEFTPSQMAGKGWRAMNIRVIEKPTRKEVTDAPTIEEVTAEADSLQPLPE